MCYCDVDVLSVVCFGGWFETSYRTVWLLTAAVLVSAVNLSFTLLLITQVCCVIDLYYLEIHSCGSVCFFWGSYHRQMTRNCFWSTFPMFFRAFHRFLQRPLPQNRMHRQRSVTEITSSIIWKWPIFHSHRLHVSFVSIYSRYNNVSSQNDVWSVGK